MSRGRLTPAPSRCHAGDVSFGAGWIWRSTPERALASCATTARASRRSCTLGREARPGSRAGRRWRGVAAGLHGGPCPEAGYPLRVQGAVVLPEPHRRRERRAGLCTRPCIGHFRRMKRLSPGQRIPSILGLATDHQRWLKARLECKSRPRRRSFMI